MASKRKTRGSTEYLIIIKSCKLPATQLPSKKEVLQHFFWLKEKTHAVQLIQTTKSEIVSQIRTDLTSIWKKASLKTIGKIPIETIVGRLIEKYETIRRSHNSKTINKKEQNYAIELNQLLDISECPCFKPKFGNKIDTSSIQSTDCTC